MAGIFHFFSALSVQDFAHAVVSALPGARNEHEQGQLLILDRADLALQRHGWCLSLAQHGQSASLELRQIGHQASFSAATTLPAPRRVRAVRAPRLQARLESLLGDAALEVVQRWRTLGFRHACRNDDDKTECTLLARQFQLADADAEPGPLLIELIPKRGYETETRALVQRLVLPWRALDHDLLHVLNDLQAARIATPAAVRPRVRRDRAPVVVAQLLLGHCATLDVCAAAGGIAPAVEELHDLRVAMRRTRSLLRAFRRTLGHALESHFNGEFRWLSRATSHLRDIDVLVAAITAPSPDYADLASEDRARIGALLACERERGARRLEKVLASRRYARVRRSWPAALVAVIEQHTPDAPPIAGAANQAIVKALRRVRRDVATAEAGYSPAALHELRKQCKRLRYLVEPFASLYPRQRVAAVQAQLKRLQSMMGEICDRHAQLALLKGSLRRRAAGDAELRRALKHARSVLRARLAASDVEAVLEALAEFDSSRHHAALDALFQAPEP